MFRKIFYIAVWLAAWVFSVVLPDEHDEPGPQDAERSLHVLRANGFRETALQRAYSRARSIRREQLCARVKIKIRLADVPAVRRFVTLTIRTSCWIALE